MADNEEITKSFKVLSDAEAKAHGLPTEPTADDIAEGERARAETQRGFPKAPQPAVSPLVAPQPKKYAELSASTRAEMEAGHKLLGGGGLSPEATYERSLKDPAAANTAPPVEIEPPAAPPTEAAKIEMEAGRTLLERDNAEQARVKQAVNESNARLAEAGAPANPRTDLAYTDQPPTPPEPPKE